MQNHEIIESRKLNWYLLLFCLLLAVAVYFGGLKYKQHCLKQAESTQTSLLNF